MSSCISATQYLSVTEGRRLKVMPGWWGGAVYHELLNPVSVPAVGLLINSSGELCVKGYKIDRKSPGMAFVTQWAMLQCSHRGSL